VPKLKSNNPSDKEVTFLDQDHFVEMNRITLSDHFI